MKGGPLGPRFRFWRDGEGQRHVFSVYAADEAPDYPDALAVVARRTPAGSIALWAGMPGETARRAAARVHAEEIHIYVFGDTPPDSLRALLMPRRAAPERLALPAPRQAFDSAACQASRHAA
ncbi:MAG: hypothetical protein B7Z15_03145 [Rhizobiales bacterium 32-66-8]|nr:MAG: hypothetical protein B7Z15_03145 [Rhizobiales bacterium 32-66-8]